jgi:hypothetical protein
MLKRPDHGFGLNVPMPYGRIDEWVFSYDGRYVTGLWDYDEESMEGGYYGDRGQLRITAKEGLRHEMDPVRRWITGDG